MTILISRPQHDLATDCLYYWSKPVIDVAHKKSARLIDLTAEKANRKLLSEYLKKIKPSLFVINGHGSPEAIFGHDNKVLISMSEDLSVFSGSIFYCRSCECALLLGPALIAAKAKGFIGYRRKFTVAFNSNYGVHLLNDPLAKLFLEPSNLVPISLIKGNTLFDSYKKSQSMMRINLRKMLSSGASFEERYYSQFLWSNIKSQTFLGSPEAKI